MGELYTGYHGTTISRGESILKNKFQWKSVFIVWANLLPIILEKSEWNFKFSSRHIFSLNDIGFLSISFSLMEVSINVL